MIVAMLPVEERRGGGMARGEGVLAPAFFVVHAVAPFDFAILFGPTRLDIAEPNASFPHCEGEGERELRAVVNLEFANGERSRLAHGGEELQAGPVILARIKAEDSIPGAVIEGRVLEAFLSSDLDLLDIHLDAVAGTFLAKERQLAGAALGGAPDRGIAERFANATNGRGGHADPVHAFQPDPRADRPELEVAACVFNQVHRRLRETPAPCGRIPWHQPGEPTTLPAAPPDPDSLAIQTKPASSSVQPVVRGVPHHHEAAFHGVMKSLGNVHGL